MTDKYYDRAEGNTFMGLADDVDMQRDLLRFFSSKRYGMTREELSSMTPLDLADEFVEHMRWQDTNEVTALSDLNFVNRAKKAEEQEDLDSFGRLILAYDNSEGGGTGRLEGAWDYLAGTMSSPTTIATILSAGTAGPVSKLGAAAARKGAQITLRQQLMRSFTKEVAGKAVLNEVALAAAKESTKKAAVKGFAGAAAIEGAIGGVQADVQERVRAGTIEGREYDASRVVTAAAISATFGGTLGALGRAYSIGKQNKAMDALAKTGLTIKAQNIDALSNASAKLKSVSPLSDEYKLIRKRAEELIALSKVNEKKTTRAFKEALDPTRVEAGRDIADRAFASSGDEMITGRLSSGTLKKVSAATLDIIEDLGYKASDDIRITQRVADELRKENGLIDLTSLEKVREKYGLSKTEFSLVFMSEMSEAGRTLSLASHLAKSADKVQAKADFDSFVGSIETFAHKGIMSADDESLRQLATSMESVASGSGLAQTLREIDSARKGLMVSQLGTTARNVISSAGRTVVDASDRAFLNLLEGRNPFSQITSALAGATINRDEAIAMRILAELDPESKAAKVFSSYTRLESDLGSQSVLSRSIDWLNVLNTATDTQFKQMHFYSSLNRQLADRAKLPMTGSNAVLPKDVAAFLSSGKTLDDLPQEVVEKAIREAKSMTFQRGYEDAVGQSGKLARGVIHASYKYPFLISSVVGVPFPRFVANQLEFIHKYGPTGAVENAWRVISGKGTGDALESTKEAVAKSLTGSMLLGTAFALRMQFPEGTNYNEVLTEAGDVMNIGGAAGPYQAFLFLGDMMSRSVRGEEVVPKMSVTASEAVKILTGLNTYGFSGNSFTTIIDALEQGQDTELLQKLLADTVSTFTLPAGTFKDLQAQFDADSMTNPYTRDITPGEGFSETTFAQRATRFLPDYGWVQFAASFNKKYDIPLYSGFNEEPVMRVNPIMNQIVGMPISPKRNDLQVEMVKLQIPEYVALGSRRVANPNVDLMVRKKLSETLPKAFVEWREDMNKAGGRGYDDLPDFEKKMELQKFISTQISKAEATAEDTWKVYARDYPVASAGFIRNNFVIQSKRYARELGSMDRAATYLEGEVTTADQYLDDSETVKDQLKRMQELLFAAEILVRQDRADRK